MLMTWGNKRIKIYLEE